MPLSGDPRGRHHKKLDKDKVEDDPSLLHLHSANPSRISTSGISSGISSGVSSKGGWQRGTVISALPRCSSSLTSIPTTAAAAVAGAGSAAAAAGGNGGSSGLPRLVQHGLSALGSLVLLVLLLGVVGHQAEIHETVIRQTRGGSGDGRASDWPVLCPAPLSTDTANNTRVTNVLQPFQLRIKVLAYSRLASLKRCLESLANAHYDGDVVRLHVFLDHAPPAPLAEARAPGLLSGAVRGQRPVAEGDREGSSSNSAEGAAAALGVDFTGEAAGAARQVQQLQQPQQNLTELEESLARSHEILQFLQEFSWPHGPKDVHYRSSSAGVVQQWVEAWWPVSDNEFAMVVEDDVEVSTMFYRFVRVLVNTYYFDPANFDPSVLGISLERPKLVPGKRGRPLHLPNNTHIYLFQMAGHAGQLLFPRPWREFRRWYDVSVARGTSPHVDGLIPSHWASKYGRRRVWTPWLLKFMHARALVSMFAAFGSAPGSASVAALAASHRNADDADDRQAQQQTDGSGVVPPLLASSHTTDTELVTDAMFEQNPELWSLPPLRNLPRYDFCFQEMATNRIASNPDELEPFLSSLAAHSNGTVVLLNALGLTTPAWPPPLSSVFASVSAAGADAGTETTASKEGLSSSLSNLAPATAAAASDSAAAASASAAAAAAAADAEAAAASHWLANWLCQARRLFLTNYAVLCDRADVAAELARQGHPVLQLHAIQAAVDVMGEAMATKLEGRGHKVKHRRGLLQQDAEVDVAGGAATMQQAQQLQQQKGRLLQQRRRQVLEAEARRVAQKQQEHQTQQQPEEEQKGNLSRSDPSVREVSSEGDEGRSSSIGRGGVVTQVLGSEAERVGSALVSSATSTRSETQDKSSRSKESSSDRSDGGSKGPLTLQSKAVRDRKMAQDTGEDVSNDEDARPNVRTATIPGEQEAATASQSTPGASMPHSQQMQQLQRQQEKLQHLLQQQKQQRDRERLLLDAVHSVLQLGFHVVLTSPTTVWLQDASHALFTVHAGADVAASVQNVSPRRRLSVSLSAAAAPLEEEAAAAESVEAATISPYVAGKDVAAGGSPAAATAAAAVTAAAAAAAVAGSLQAEQQVVTAGGVAIGDAEPTGVGGAVADVGVAEGRVADGAEGAKSGGAFELDLLIVRSSKRAERMWDAVIALHEKSALDTTQHPAEVPAVSQHSAASLSSSSSLPSRSGQQADNPRDDAGTRDRLHDHANVELHNEAGALSSASASLAASDAPPSVHLSVGAIIALCTREARDVVLERLSPQVVQQYQPQQSSGDYGASVSESGESDGHRGSATARHLAEQQVDQQQPRETEKPVQQRQLQGRLLQGEKEETSEGAARSATFRRRAEDVRRTSVASRTATARSTREGSDSVQGAVDHDGSSVASGSRQPSAPMVFRFRPSQTRPSSTFPIENGDANQYADTWIQLSRTELSSVNLDGTCRDVVCQGPQSHV